MSESDEESESRGLHEKFTVTKDGEKQDGCFVLKPDDDRAARRAIRAYAAATDNDELADDLRERFDVERTAEEEWEEHNETFQYDPPELPGDAWSSEQYQELYDRLITRRTQWFCQKCSGQGPIGTLKKARRHVEGQHATELIEEYETPREEQDAATDGGRGPSDTERRESENHGIGEFSGGDDE